MKTNNFNNLILGKKAVLDIVRLNPNIIKLIHLLNYDKNTINELKKLNINYSIHNNDNFFSRFKSNINHQGYALEFKDSNNFLKIVDMNYIKNLLLFESSPIILMLDEIMDMQNFGAILRTAYASGVNAVIYKKNNQAQINDYIIKTSMGFINKIPIFPVINLRNTIDELKKNGFWVYSTTLNNKSVDYDKVDYNNPVVIVMGNEKNGVSRLIQENSDYWIKIPMVNNVESLNVSVATGIILFNIIRSRRKE